MSGKNPPFNLIQVSNLSLEYNIFKGITTTFLQNLENNISMSQNFSHDIYDFIHLKLAA